MAYWDQVPPWELKKAANLPEIKFRTYISFLVSVYNSAYSFEAECDWQFGSVAIDSQTKVNIGRVNWRVDHTQQMLISSSTRNFTLTYF